MKVQFGPGRVRLRVDRAEFEALVGGATIEAGVAWPGVEWRVRVRAGAAFGVDAGATFVDVTLPRPDIDALAARLPARDGLCFAIPAPDGEVELRFDVDLHDGRGRPR